MLPTLEDEVSELESVDEAFAAALAESDVPTDEDVEVGAEQAEVFPDEQAVDESQGDVPQDDGDEELFPDAEGLGIEEPEPVPFDPMTYRVAVPGEPEPLTIQQLIEGNMRNNKFTQNSQVLAEQRRQNEKAIKLYEAVQTDPLRVGRQIAEELGLIAPGAQPVKAVDFSVINTAEAVEAEVERRVAEAIERHPAVVEANAHRAQAWVDSEFARIEQLHDIKLGPKSRHTILAVAGNKGIADLDIVYSALLAQRQARSQDQQRLKAAAPARPTGRASKHEVADDADSLERAFELALAGVDAD